MVFPITLILIVAYFRQLKNPEKTFLWNFINTSLSPIRFLGLGPFKHGPLTMDNAIKGAMKKTKLSDFGSTDFVKNYNKIMESDFHKTQKLSNLGYASAQIEFNMTFVRRLKFIQYLKEFPDVLKTPVRSPVFVMGLPRTGTTYLHRLLSLDPKVRAPLLWELLNPVPIVPPTATPDEKEKCRDKRAKHIRKILKMRKSIGDRALEHIHEVDADLPEECIMSLTDEIPVALQFLYSDYMQPDTFLSIDVSGAYLHYKKYLQLLSFQMGETETTDPRRWMLKCPVHLFYPKQIAAAFPDAKLIW